MNLNSLAIELPDQVRTFWHAYLKLKGSFPDSGLAFTPDGKLVGDIGEAAAASAFDLTLCTSKIPGVDARAADGRTVQIKATARPNRGPAFSKGEGSADHLIFLQLDLERASAAIVYNGPEAPIRAMLSNPLEHTETANLKVVQKKNTEVDDSERLDRVR